MVLLDDIAIYFEIPATDALGREAVAGKLRGTQESVIFHWRLKDRTFRKTDGDMKSIPIPFQDVESIRYKATLGFLKPRLIFQVTDPRHLADVPGVHVGKAVLLLEKRAKAEAKKLIKFVEYKKAEAQASLARKRLKELESEPTID